ncbi:hypothetical protein BJY52DRAFT_1418195 [Lactarius psammicola]|nr:hypothetical protein BJY52DRAFT_1418195 [Lactarius psammicola]
MSTHLPAKFQKERDIDSPSRNYLLVTSWRPEVRQIPANPVTGTETTLHVNRKESVINTGTIARIGTWPCEKVRGLTVLLLQQCWLAGKEGSAVGISWADTKRKDRVEEHRGALSFRSQKHKRSHCARTGVLLDYEIDVNPSDLSGRKYPSVQIFCNITVHGRYLWVVAPIGQQGSITQSYLISFDDSTPTPTGVNHTAQTIIKLRLSRPRSRWHNTQQHPWGPSAQLWAIFS